MRSENVFTVDSAEFSGRVLAPGESRDNEAEILKFESGGEASESHS